MRGNKKKKRRLIRLTPFWLRLAIILLLLIGLILAVGTLVLPGFGIDLHLPFTSRTRIAESEILLKDIKPLFLLNTVEYTYQSVFPYDFIPPRTDPLEAYRRVLQGLEVSTAEKQAAELYRLCLDAGIRLGAYDYSFVVITTHVKGGFDLSRGAWAESSRDLIFMNPKIGSISILLPEPEISDFIIQDETSTEYEYPDIDIDAEQWRRITAYVEKQVRLQVIEDGILEKTEENIRQVLRRLLQELGWKFVTFRQ